MHVDNLKTGMGGIFPTGELSNAINQGFPAPRKPMVKHFTSTPPDTGMRGTGMDPALLQGVLGSCTLS